MQVDVMDVEVAADGESAHDLLLPGYGRSGDLGSNQMIAIPAARVTEATGRACSWQPVSRS